MKTLITLTLFVLLYSQTGHAQFSEDFDEDIVGLSSNCWIINQVNYSTTSGDVINGTGSAYTNPPTSGSGERTLATPYLTMTSTALTVSFSYKTSNKINGNATRTIKIGIVDRNGAFTLLQELILNKNSPTTVFNHNATYTIPMAGVYRLELRIGGATGDGNSRVIFDDLSVSATPYYGPTNHCNQPAIAINDTINASSIVAVSGNVLLNDQFPADGEIYTPAIVTPPASGTIIFNADGSFTYTPSPSFTGGSVTFTYSISDNGYPAAVSNLATVTIIYPSPAILPMSVINFVAAGKNDMVALSWKAAEVHDGDYFEVEKSVDGNTFAPISKIPANVHNTAYTAADNHFTKSAYYRLKTVNLDQTVSYSIILFVRSAVQAGAVSVIENPVTSVLKLDVRTDYEIGLIQIFSASGNKVMDVKNAKSNSFHTVNVQSLAPGVYVISAVSKNGRYASKFVKR